MLSFLNIESGSKGNATLIYSGTTLLLIDMGVPVCALKAGLDNLGKCIFDIEGLLITHDHSDHIGGIPLVEGDIPLVSAIGNYPHLDYECEPFEEFMLGDISITPLRTSHDATNPIGFLFVSGETTLVYMTDTGYIPSINLSKMANADYYVIESNYDVDMLANSARPEMLKKRIASRHGHLSNVQSAKYLAGLIGPKTKGIYLAHISEETNTPEVAIRTHQEIYAKKKVSLDGVSLVALSQRRSTQGGDKR